MLEIAPLVRRPVTVDPDRTYREIGIRSFGRGVFHKAPGPGLEIGAKRVFSIQPGDLLFNIVFAWEGAVAIAGESEHGTIASHRFLTCVVDTAVADAWYLYWWFSRDEGRGQLLKASPGGAGRNRTLGVEKLSAIPVPLPPVEEQRRIVARIDELGARLTKAQSLRAEQQQEAKQLLSSAFHSITAGAPRVSMKEVAPIVRRPINLDFDKSYPELGIRSFFKGTFHKPAVTALEMGSKRVFWIQPGDLLFSNVFAWEGGIAIATANDAGRVGSHRFITCLPNPKFATARFLFQHFQSEEGFARIQAASPGGAGRNRTLGLKALGDIDVPIPPLEKQRWFSDLHSKVEELTRKQSDLHPFYNAMLPSILDNAFNGRF